MTFRRMRSVHELFQLALGKKYVEPIATRVQEVLLPRLLPLLAGTVARDAFLVAEFVTCLLFMPVSTAHYGRKEPIPLPGLFLYESDAQRPIKNFLRKRPDWLEAACRCQRENAHG